MTGRVVCVGDLMIDVLAELPGPLSPGSDAPASISVSAGGSAANTAAWLAAVGVPVTFVGRVGKDSFGEQAEQDLARAGVISSVTVDPAAPTGVCIVLIGPDGERTMVPSAGANARLTAADVLGVLAPDDWLHVSAYPLLRPATNTAVRAVLLEAERRGLPISIDAASAAPLLAAGAAEFLSWLPHRSLLIANADEARSLTGLHSATASAEALATGVGAVVIKLGSTGAVVACGGGVETIGTEPVPVRDTTGAGDAFAAGLLADLRAGTWPGGLEVLAAAARCGHRQGAVAVEQLGARPQRREPARET
ncbi:carbohydrate kinase family protein [Jatrophihabitans telluris]|uniref:Carbohydrate kinase family protein n=1 Tax=Jatrophihabitans telluris TaxID=2038343 RepID=A0ABY4R5G6_9ACTN|nr:carbohydrate kinase family protein [Jatrophihabitans telluris]UQX90151.1 carbohydrate kinase family protein [Jatrophihabitans telluris]